MLESDRPLGAAVDDLGDHADRDGAAVGLPVLAADGRRLLGVLRPEDLVDTGHGRPAAADAVPRCVVELPGALPPGWAPPAGFTVLEGAERLVVGPRVRLHELVASPSDAGDAPGARNDDR